MGYVFDFIDAMAYQQWYHDSRNQFVVDMQTQLILDMLRPVRGESVLEIGCGTGMGLLPLVEMGLDATGLDPSPYMLDIAEQNVKNRAELHRGVAEDLPFDDNSFNHAMFVTTLEFVEEPVKALEEACRVAKDRLFIGVLNRYAIKGIQRRVKGVFSKTIFNRAHFFSVWEIKQMVKTVLGDVPISWRTVCQFSATPGRVMSRFEKSGIVQRCPFGTFAGIGVIPVPHLRTTPLSLKYPAKHTIRPVVG